MSSLSRGRTLVTLACFALSCGSGSGGDGGDGHNEAGASSGGMSAGGTSSGAGSSGKGGAAGSGGASVAGATNAGGTNATGGTAAGGRAAGGSSAGGLAGLGGGTDSGAGGMSSGAAGFSSGAGGALSGAGGSLAGNGGTAGFGGKGDGGTSPGGKGAGGAGGVSQSGAAGVGGAGGNGAGGSGGTSGSDCPANGNVTYTLMRASNPTADQQEAYELITEAMDTAVRYYNCYTNISKVTTVQYNPSVQTADGNSNGNIRFGGKQYMEYSRAMHEIAHTVGIGTYQEYQNLIEDGIFVGAEATAQVRENTGNPEEVVHADSQHFWPGGLNYASEAESEKDLVDHCLMVAAIRRDMGFDP